MQNRSTVIKAYRILADFCSSKAEALSLPQHMVMRAREAYGHALVRGVLADSALGHAHVDALE